MLTDNRRIEAMREQINALNDAGVRRTWFYPMAYESLKTTRGESIQMRRAKAEAYLLENGPIELHPYELLAGTMTAYCPVIDHMGKEERTKRAEEILDAYLAKKRSEKAEDANARNRIKTFEAEFTSKKSRWALMSRVYHDASITYEELQALIAEMAEVYRDEKDLEYYEIGRELERGFKIDYGKEVKQENDSLPWFAANHLSLNYGKVVKQGMDGVLAEIREREAKADPEKKEYYQAAYLTAQAEVTFILRHAKALREAAQKETGARRAELLQMAENCEHAAHRPSESFWEGLQLVWLLHMGMSYLWGSALSFGRFDQYMRDLYLQTLEDGIMTREQAEELLCCFWLKVNEPKLRTVQSLTLGGITPEGEDAANELTRLCLEVVREMKLPYPNVGVRIHEKNPSWLLDAVAESVKSGSGQPMIMTDKVWIANLKRLGYADHYANDYYNMGCVEIMVPGKQPNWGVTDPIAFPMLFEKVFARYRNGEVQLSTFEEFESEYLQVLSEAVTADYEEARSKIADLPGRCYDPYASWMIDGCLESGRDMFQGGSELGTHWSFYAYGLGTAADSMAAVKKHVYEEKQLTIEELSRLLADNFNGAEGLRLLLENKTAHYGNDDLYVDELGKHILAAFDNQVLSYNRPDEKNKYVTTLFSYFFHIYHGEITGATPNGRKKGGVFSDSMSPAQGKDTEGPTRMLNSVLHLDHSGVTGGYALNIKINPELVTTEAGTKALRTLIAAYVDAGGPQIQFNFVNVEELKKAKEHPADYRNLIVRIGGYCEYFINLDSVLQDEIITRTVHGL